MTEMMVLLVLLVFLTILFIVSFIISMQILDFVPFFRVRSLTENEMREIEKNGLIHCTSYDAKRAILETQQLKGSWRITNFSNSFKRTIFFFSGEISERAKWFNYGSQYQCRIIIKKISPGIVEKLLIRQYDKVLLLRENIRLSDVEYEIEDNIYQQERQCNNILKKIRHSWKPALCVSIMMLVCFFVLLGIIYFSIDAVI